MSEDELMLETTTDFKTKAIAKLNEEISLANDENYAKLVLTHLINRCSDDAGLAEDICQEHKAWNKCFDYIKDKARKQTKGYCCAVRNDVVYEWAEDYYHLDDKAEEERKAKEKAEREKAAKERTIKAKSKKAAVPQKKNNNNNTKPKRQPKSNNIDGQVSFFDLM